MVEATASGAGEAEQHRRTRAHDEAAELRQRQHLGAGIADEPSPEEGRQRCRARRQHVPAEPQERDAGEMIGDDGEEARPAHREQRVPDLAEAEISHQPVPRRIPAIATAMVRRFTAGPPRRATTGAGS